ncbi:GNAT family N-acetyltransferase [Deinococcus yavapaiensis]|uniref:Aminoglycoside 6'-N-acetyltransferase n=1 Tax=Deinococcus yavapaiensis KR-236 TaxID=694435 RepID=A0A318SBD1_9DEIO|nr:GNAT family protein [Deinococcus yavapaiensis]PYE53939.1 aminoglycoside 6'-N-acetyltransferase [Deinococcus yavapaiensis KR-236]
MSKPTLLLPLQTDRLTLRLPRPADDQDLLAYYSRADVAQYLLEEPWTPNDAEEQLAKRLTRVGLDSEVGALALVWEHAGRVIGDVSLWLTKGRGDVAEIGWVMHPDFSGKGLATEAVRAVLTAAFDVYGLHRVAAQMDARNAASARLCERLGMQREAHLRQDWWSKGEWTDTLIYGMLASDRVEKSLK